MQPLESTGRRVTRAPRDSRNPQGASTEGCSTRVVTMWGRRRPAAKNAPLRAKLLDSLPPLVNTTSPGEHPSSAATRLRALSTSSRAGAPAQWEAEGLPKASSMASAMAVRTSGARGVLAL